MTISQAKLKGNLGAVADYFLEANEGLGDYYITEDGAAEPAPPRGLGFLAKRLGLTGAVIAEQLLRLLDGRHPLTGKRLIPYRKDRVAGVDQTASAPKSVSVVWAVGAGRRTTWPPVAQCRSGASTVARKHSDEGGIGAPSSSDTGGGKRGNRRCGTPGWSVSRRHCNVATSMASRGGHSRRSPGRRECRSGRSRWPSS